jgi:hypothetical protein
LLKVIDFKQEFDSIQEKIAVENQTKKVTNVHYHLALAACLL